MNNEVKHYLADSPKTNMDNIIDLEAKRLDKVNPIVQGYWSDSPPKPNREASIRRIRMMEAQLRKHGQSVEEWHAWMEAHIRETGGSVRDWRSKVEAARTSN